ncbi:Triacylglycerol lipase [Halogeometricum pallidum JCM 14848]|uniref:Triacylglycerol lipase n=1 Tax=Halogeometricum pallidum JCM 14848 TaxID=1227487 RepID=M0DBT1_HALPD|nr:alpha/beta hydrolase [Halogeometricum pallidum]ELZ32930.1 Triacylglycerol lipase [Halogeometricum pallidum JCM 14848]
MHADEIHPQAREAMAAQSDLSRLRRLGPKPLRLLARAANWWQNRDPPAVGGVEDRTIPGPAGKIPVRVYRPRGDGPSPTVVFFHGGGFVLGSLGSHDILCRRLVRESDCAVVSVDYRLAPEHPFPAAVEDAYAATEWAAENPDFLGSDRGLAVVGDSAGGTLAAVVSLMAADRGGPDIDHQALVYPAVGADERHESVERHAGTVLSKADLTWFRDCYFESDIDERNPYADPMHARDCSGVAPATVVTAGFDPLRDGGTAYAERLVSEGVPVRYENYEDMVHGFATMYEVDRSRELVADLAADLRGAFAPRE